MRPNRMPLRRAAAVIPCPRRYAPLATLVVFALALAAAPGTAAALEPGSKLAADAGAVDLATGKRVRIADYKGKVVIIDVWASWCAPCKKELPALDARAKAWAEKGIVVLAVNIDSDRAKAEKFLKSAGIKSVTVLLDPKKSLAGLLDPPTMPSSYVFDKKGVLRVVHKGYEPGDEAKLGKEAEALAAK